MSREEQVHAEFCSLLWRTWDRCVAREFIRADLDMRLRLRPIFLGGTCFPAGTNAIARNIDTAC